LLGFIKTGTIAVRANRVPKRVSKDAGTLFPIVICGIAEFTVFIYKRKLKQLARMNTAPFNSGEAVYLRLLLYSLPAYSFKQLKTYVDKNGEKQEAETFQEAAIEQSLV
jgi:hypothetical protein